VLDSAFVKTSFNKQSLSVSDYIDPELLNFEPIKDVDYFYFNLLHVYVDHSDEIISTISEGDLIFILTGQCLLFQLQKFGFGETFQRLKICVWNWVQNEVEAIWEDWQSSIGEIALIFNWDCFQIHDSLLFLPLTFFATDGLTSENVIYIFNASSTFYCKYKLWDVFPEKFRKTIWPTNVPSNYAACGDTVLTVGGEWSLSNPTTLVTSLSSLNLGSTTSSSRLVLALRDRFGFLLYSLAGKILILNLRGKPAIFRWRP
jgi:hypothetical protein